MQFVYILCEGQSEEAFVKQVLSPYLQANQIYTTPIVLGDVSRYSKIREHLKMLGKNSNSILTTMLDYYKLPSDTPGAKECKETAPSAIAEYIEQQIYDDLAEEIKCQKFIPNIIMHEYEALLFSNVSCFSVCKEFTAPKVKQLEKEVASFPTPEYVNNSEQTAPSKRILRICPSYQKNIDGTRIAKEVGIETMLEKCHHFSDWVNQLILLHNGNVY